VVLTGRPLYQSRMPSRSLPQSPLKLVSCRAHLEDLLNGSLERAISIQTAYLSIARDVETSGPDLVEQHSASADIQQYAELLAHLQTCQKSLDNVTPAQAS
jgi:hypothetical protein